MPWGPIHKSKFLLLPILWLVLVVFFQNCTSGYNSALPLDQTAQQNLEGESPSGISFDGNGGTYSGKVQINAPASVSPGTSYVVGITGGAPPYKITSPQGVVDVLSVSGNLYELWNQFPIDVSSFQLLVTDSEGNTAQASIDIVETDNVFNFRQATAALMDESSYIVFSLGMRKITVFDINGVPKGMLYPYGDFQASFKSEPFVFIEKDSMGNLYVLDQVESVIHKYNNKYRFVKAIDLNTLSQVKSTSSFEYHDGSLFVVDGSANKIHKLSLDGAYIETLALSGVSFTKIASVAFDSNRNLTYVADERANQIKIFKNGNWVKTISSVNFPNGNKHNLLGPSSLNVGTNGELFFLDSIYREGPYEGVNGGHEMGEEWTIRLDYSETQGVSARKIHSRYLSLFHTATNCLSLTKDKFLYCDRQRTLYVTDYEGNELEHYFPRLGGYGTGVSDPRKIAIDDIGNSYLVSDYDTVVKVGADQEIEYREHLRDVKSIVVVDDKLYVSSGYHNMVKVYKKSDFEFLFEFRVRDRDGKAHVAKNMAANDKNLYVGTDEAGFLVLDFQGNLIKQIDSFENSKTPYYWDEVKTGQFEVTDDGVLYFITTQKAIIKYDTQTEQLDYLWFKYNNWDHITLDKKKNVFYINMENTLVQFDAKTWKELGRFGTGGVLPGTFNGITGLAIDDDYIYVCDNGNQRIQRISRNLVD